ncbi:isoprenylcysteine carboxylmethyltransferase family protein [Thalassomonas sp. RHCl1]|uniref:methyltransferase family protein n=1 Tax=Thalassomonas sp. RHCl1 TaxID=2995320 RepID=UPI00248AEEEF|nr:isoprenylcysteine carboxylmethyltransferase family protein [Thalassomonas sp. RHCl1]
MDNNNDKSGAAVKFPPPLIFLLFMLLGAGIHHYWPVTITDITWLKYLGLTLVLAGVVIVIHISRSFKQVETNIEPWKPTSAIISSGYFAYSRNPIYTTFCLAPIGIGLFLNSFWILLSVIPSAYLVYQLAIKKEEAYLEHKFGDEYLAYKNKVRRWL